MSAEIDKGARQTYKDNFGEDPYCDVTHLTDEAIPQRIKDFDVLLAGFPCQAFSIAGRRGGFEDTRGTLFFDVARIIKIKKPAAFLLENVKGLVNHKSGATLGTILDVLKNGLGEGLEYEVDFKVLNSKNFGVPQNRERIYIIGYKKTKNNPKPEVKFPDPLDYTPKLDEILEKEPVCSRYYLSQKYLDTLKAHKERHAGKGNGFGYEVVSEKGLANALMVGGMGRERNLVYDPRLTDFTPKTNIQGPINNEFIRKMTPKEWARLQGFPPKFQIHKVDGQAYRQLGNSVTVPVINAVAKVMIKTLDDYFKKEDKNGSK